MFLSLKLRPVLVLVFGYWDIAPHFGLCLTDNIACRTCTTCIYPISIYIQKFNLQPPFSRLLAGLSTKGCSLCPISFGYANSCLLYYWLYGFTL